MVGHFIQTQRMATTVNPITPLRTNYMKGSPGLMHLATRDTLRDLLVIIGVRGISPIKNVFTYGDRTGTSSCDGIPKEMAAIRVVQSMVHTTK